MESAVLEEENKQKLKLFKEEIKKIKEFNDTLREVKDVENLQLEEREIWENYKKSFMEMDVFFSTFTLELYEEKKDELENIFTNLKNAGYIRKNRGQKDRDEFIAWVRNRVGGFNMYLENLLTSDDAYRSEDLAAIKNNILEEKKKISL